MKIPLCVLILIGMNAGCGSQDKPEAEGIRLMATTVAADSQPKGWTADCQDMFPLIRRTFPALELPETLDAWMEKDLWRKSLILKKQTAIARPASYHRFEISLKYASSAKTLTCDIPASWLADVVPYLRWTYPSFLQRKSEDSGLERRREAVAGIITSANPISIQNKVDVNLFWSFQVQDLWQAEDYVEATRQLNLPQLKLKAIEASTTVKPSVLAVGLTTSTDAAAVKVWGISPSDFKEVFSEFSFLPLGPDLTNLKAGKINETFFASNILNLSLLDHTEKDCLAVTSDDEKRCDEILDYSNMREMNSMLSGEQKQICVHVAFTAAVYKKDPGLGLPYSVICVDKDGVLQERQDSYIPNVESLWRRS